MGFRDPGDRHMVTFTVGVHGMCGPSVCLSRPYKCVQVVCTEPCRQAWAAGADGARVPPGSSGAELHHLL